MPKRTGKDKKGCYIAWGSLKQYYTCGSDESKARAESRLNKQIQAVYASGYKGD